MEKQMVGDVIVVVIDEIGEVTFGRFKDNPTVVELTRKETLTRTVAALCEMLDVVWLALPATAAGFEAHKALNLLLRDFKQVVDRMEVLAQGPSDELPF